MICKTCTAHIVHNTSQMVIAVCTITSSRISTCINAWSRYLIMKVLCKTILIVFNAMMGIAANMALKLYLNPGCKNVSKDSVMLWLK